jgi:Flp pilus assembly protein TadG
MTFIRAFKRHQGGAAAVEMALIIPLLLAILFGGFEAGHYFYNEQKIIKAVRDGARFAGRQKFDAYTCPGTVKTATKTLIQVKTRTGKLKDGKPMIANWTDNNDVKVTVTCPNNTGGIFAGADGGARVVTVTATADYPSLFGALGFIDATRSVRASAQSVVMGL